MDDPVNPLERDHFLSVVLPSGLEKNATVHGSKPVMDLLVTLCASYHLNPSDYTVEVLSPNKNNISFKPNSPIGSLEAEKIVLKPKVIEEKIKRPYMPEATVRLLINYNKSHKAVVRVNPKVPLEMLLPVVCDKCEFNLHTTVLLRDCQSEEPLDITKTLNEHGVREVFAKDMADEDRTNYQDPPSTPKGNVTPTPEVISPPPPQDLPNTKKKPKLNSGFLSLFRRRKKKPEQQEVLSAPASPGLNKPADGNALNGSSTNTLPADMRKKRPAPQPPIGASQSVPNNLSSCHLNATQRLGDSTLRRTKRRAPPPPSMSPHQEQPKDTIANGNVRSLNPLEELRESDESDYVNISLSSSSSPHPSHPPSSSRPSLAHLHGVANPYLPTFHARDLSDARAALAKVLTTSMSKGALVRRLRNSATFPKMHGGSSFVPVTQRGPDLGGFAPDRELESVLRSNLPTESDWEDPMQRKGTTTFKVVPSKTFKSCDPEPPPASPESSRKPTETAVEAISQDGPEPFPLLEPCPVESEALDHAASESAPASPETSYKPAESAVETTSQEGSESFPGLEPCLVETETLGRPASPQDRDSPLPDDGDTHASLEENQPQAPVEVVPFGCSEEPNGDGPFDSEESLADSQCAQCPNTDGDHESSYSDERNEYKVEDEEKEEEEEVEDYVEDKEEEEEEEESFPPPPPPVLYDEGLDFLEDGGEEIPASSQPPSPLQNGSVTAGAPSAPSIPAARRLSSTPSRFAEAVALAVQRSRLQRRAKGLSPDANGRPNGTLPSSPRSSYQYGA